MDNAAAAEVEAGTSTPTAEHDATVAKVSENLRLLISWALQLGIVAVFVWLTYDIGNWIRDTDRGANVLNIAGDVLYAIVTILGLLLAILPSLSSVQLGSRSLLTGSGRAHSVASAIYSLRVAGFEPGQRQLLILYLTAGGVAAMGVLGSALAVMFFIIDNEGGMYNEGGVYLDRPARTKGQRTGRILGLTVCCVSTAYFMLGCTMALMHASRDAVKTKVAISASDDSRLLIEKARDYVTDGRMLMLVTSVYTVVTDIYSAATQESTSDAPEGEEADEIQFVWGLVALMITVSVINIVTPILWSDRTFDVTLPDEELQAEVNKPKTSLEWLLTRMRTKSAVAAAKMSCEMRVAAVEHYHFTSIKFFSQFSVWLATLFQALIMVFFAQTYATVSTSIASMASFVSAYYTAIGFFEQWAAAVYRRGDICGEGNIDTTDAAKVKMLRYRHFHIGPKAPQARVVAAQENEKAQADIVENAGAAPRA